MSTQRLAFFAPADAEIPNGHDLARVLAGRLGVSLSQGDGDYHSGEWVCPDTGAKALIDCGSLPIQEQETGLNQDFEGWAAIPLSIQIPLAGPHWWSVEVAAWVEGLLEGHPDWGVVDEGELGPDDEIRPGPLRRPAILASWEAQHQAYSAGLAMPRMDRRQSLALWRYLKQKPAGQLDYGHLTWPTPKVLAHGHHAYSIAVWPAGDRALALPPVHYVVIQRSSGAGLISAEEIRTVAKPAALKQGGAHLIENSPELTDLLAKAPLTPPDDYSFLVDGAWSDS